PTHRQLVEPIIVPAEIHLVGVAGAVDEGDAGGASLFFRTGGLNGGLEKVVALLPHLKAQARISRGEGSSSSREARRHVTGSRHAEGAKMVGRRELGHPRGVAGGACVPTDVTRIAG